jgi:D-alanyl-D-alanine carboxypeptidase
MRECKEKNKSTFSSNIFVKIIILMFVICQVILIAIITTGMKRMENINNTSDNSATEAINNGKLTVVDYIDNNSATEAVNNGILTVVNHTKSIPADWTVDLVELRNNKAIDSWAYPDLQAMMDDARAEGFDPLICSAYRTQEDQQELYDNKVNYYLEQGYEESVSRTLAAEVVTYPGMSEHQLGLAVDICSISYQVLDSSQEDTATQQWLMENCYKYGYILRYPKDKTDVTGISYEPWHYRYVGREAAQEIYDKGLCLEEYMSNR